MSLTRKFREAMLAWQLESQISKDEILDLYLNTVYFGSNAYGVEAAARTYFDKEPSELTLPEAALLAGLPQAPTDYSPRVNMAKAKTRRQEVLKAMYTNGFIDVSQYEAAIATNIELAKSSPYVKVQEPYVVAYTRQQLIDMFGDDAVYKGGLHGPDQHQPRLPAHRPRGHRFDAEPRRAIPRRRWSRSIRRPG